MAKMINKMSTTTATKASSSNNECCPPLPPPPPPHSDNNKSNYSSIRIMAAIIMLTILLLWLPASTNAVRINSISRPQSFRYNHHHANHHHHNRNENEIILDCDFSIDSNDEMLVVKWFLNDDTQHIYQWIQSRDYRHFSERLKPYIDDKFMVQDYQTRYRALRLLNPPPTLSGKYTCSVSSLQNEDINSTYLVIYEPAKSFEMVAVKSNELEETNEIDDDDNDNNNGFNITCTAFGLYPEPEMKLFKIIRSPQSSTDTAHNDTIESHEIESNQTTIISFRSMTNGFYSITLISHIEQSSMNHLGQNRTTRNSVIDSSENNQLAEHYECRLSIPNTDYTEIKRLAIQDGWHAKWRPNSAATDQISLLLLLYSILIAIGMRSIIITP